MLLSVSEYAKKIGVTPDTVRQKILRGNLNAIKIGNQWVISSSEKYIDKRRKLYNSGL